MSDATPQATFSEAARTTAKWLVVAILWAVYPTATIVHRQLRRFYRRRHNQCLKCGYDLTGNMSGRCSECGAAVGDNVKPT